MVIIIIIIIIGPLSFQRFFFLKQDARKKVAFARIQFEQKKNPRSNLQPKKFDEEG